MKDCLFIGGPYARSVMSVSEDREFLRAPERFPAQAFVNEAEPPKAVVFSEVTYRRGEIYDAKGERHSVFVAEGFDAIQELMRFYAQGGAK